MRLFRSNVEQSDHGDQTPEPRPKDWRQSIHNMALDHEPDSTTEVLSKTIEGYTEYIERIDRDILIEEDRMEEQRERLAALRGLRGRYWDARDELAALLDQHRSS